MKKYFSHTYSFFLLLAIAAASCKNQLDVAPQGQITEDQIKNDPAAAQQLVDGVYNSMWLGGFGPDVHGLQYVILTNIASDDAEKGSSPQDYMDAGQVDNFTLTPSNSNINNVWSGYYQAIARANQALDKIPLSPQSDADKNKLIAQVRFLRGYFYFNLVRLFGGVPKIDKALAPQDANNDQYQTRAPQDSIYNLITRDIQFAIANLPIKGQIDAGRATKGAAQALLAKVNLYQRNWQNVLNLTDSILNGQSGAYSLLTRYEDNFRDVGDNGAESLFEVQTGINAQCNASIQLYVVSQGPRSGGKGGWADLGFGFGTPTQSLANAYEPNDKRRAGSIIFINPDPAGTVLWDGFRIPSQDSVQNSMYNYKAYHSRTAEKSCGNNDYLPKNLKIIRYAEVLLMNAEAANMLGNTGKALHALNQVRTRAGLPEVTASLSQTQLNDTIWHERHVELALEHDRFFDLVRQGRAGQVLRAQGKNFVDGKNEVFPIPQPQIDLSNNRLLQNKGY